MKSLTKILENFEKKKKKGVQDSIVNNSEQLNKQRNKNGLIKEVKLYDIIPFDIIDLDGLTLGWRAFTKLLVKEGTLLYEINYIYRKFNVRISAPRDCFYVHNGKCMEHAKLFNYGYIDTEPVLCWFWESRQDFENSNLYEEKQLLLPPSYFNYDSSRKRYEGIEEEIQHESDCCYTYLMKDTSNGYYKIGMSNNPTYRERTLQSEKPTIELVHSRKFCDRKKARNHEKELHEKFKSKRIRGEWFDLDIKDVVLIKDWLDGCF